jgi:hypothetical protein
MSFELIIHPLSRMKPHLFVLALLFASPWVASPVAAQAQAPAAGDAYQKFIDQLVTPEYLADCISKMDALIDEGEQLSASSKASTGGIDAETKIGLHLAFCIFSNKQHVTYYLILSRNGEPLSLTAATKLAALFCDRAGLPHPVVITEGEKPIFYVQWNIKHADWHDMQEMMRKVRAENRAEQNPQKAFIAAINREVAAREAPPPAIP